MFCSSISNSLCGFEPSENVCSCTSVVESLWSCCLDLNAACPGEDQCLLQVWQAAPHNLLGSVKECAQGLGFCPTGTFIQAGNIEVVQVAQLSAVASSQSEENDLLVPVHLVDGVNITTDIQPTCPVAVVLFVAGGLGLSVGHWLVELLQLAASLG